MAWFDVSGGRLRFRGTSREPVREWLESSEGVDAIQSAARGVRFSLLGRARVARRRLARTLSDAINSPAASTALTAECEHFLETWTQLAYAPALPRRTLDGRRLVVVPRAMIVDRSLGGAERRLGAALGPSLPDGFALFFARWVVRAMDAAIRRAAPAPGRPLRATESWSCVQVDPEFLWVASFVSDNPWRGHVMMFELPPSGLRRRDRPALAAVIAELTTSLPSLTRIARDGTVRMAVHQMASLRF
ncbi:MAG TPA: hypothetical protein VJ813_03130 [Vicinamibacterales bacterium]|nr:hypothetical protein [Vicinamibacterales bacterium]